MKLVADTDNEWRYDDISAGDSQDLVLNSPKQPKIGPKSAGNSQDCPCLASGKGGCDDGGCDVGYNYGSGGG